MILKNNLPLMSILGVVGVGNGVLGGYDVFVLTVQLYIPASLLLIVTVTATLIGSVDISGTRFKSFSGILNVFPLT